MTSDVAAGLRRVRPSRLWYLVAALIPAAVLADALLAPALFRGGDLGRPMPLNRPVPVSISSTGERMVWVRESGAPVAGVSCGFGGDSRLVSTTVARVMFEPIEIEADGARWRGVLTLSAEPAGTYQVTCVTPGGTAPTVSIGTTPRFVSPKARALITLITAGLSLAGVLAGLLIAVVVAVRRRAAVRLLRASPVP